MPMNVETAAETITKIKTLGLLALKEKDKETIVAKRVSPPMRISIVPITKMVL